MTDKPYQQDSDDFNDDELFEGLSEEDYNTDDESVSDELDNDLSNGYVHESIDDDELYHYQDEEQVDVADESAPTVKAMRINDIIARVKSTLSEGNISDKLRSLLIPLLLGGLIVIFAIYKMTQLFSAPSPPTPTQQQQGIDVRDYIPRPQPPSDELTSPSVVAQQTVAKKTNPQAVVPTATATVQPVITKTQPVPTNDVATVAATTAPMDLAALEQITTDVTTKTPTIQTQLTQLQTLLTALSAQQQQRTEQIHTLQQQLNSVNTELTRSTTTIRKALVGLYHQVMALHQTQQRQQQITHLNQQARKQYAIQAIIPGRAWLKTQQGNVMTVTQGDIVPGYGAVTDIDVDNGVVRTGSGAVFGYALSR